MSNETQCSAVWFDISSVRCYRQRGSAGTDRPLVMWKNSIPPSTLEYRGNLGVSLTPHVCNSASPHRPAAGGNRPDHRGCGVGSVPRGLVRRDSSASASRACEGDFTHSLRWWFAQTEAHSCPKSVTTDLVPPQYRMDREEFAHSHHPQHTGPQRRGSLP